MTHRPLLLVAASGLARETLTALTRSGRTVRGILDDDPELTRKRVGGVPVLGALDAVGAHPGTALVLCAGKGTSRRAIAARLAELGVAEDRYASVIDPSVFVPPGCRVGAGTILLAGTVMTADVAIGRHVVCMPNVTLTHDDVLDDFATLTAGVSLAGGVRVGEAAYLGMNATVRERVVVGAGATLGMGAALLTDQPANSIWAGVPARPLTPDKEVR